jgi:hypothetical protein
MYLSKSSLRKRGVHCDLWAHRLTVTCSFGPKQVVLLQRLLISGLDHRGHTGHGRDVQNEKNQAQQAAAYIWGYFVCGHRVSWHRLTGRVENGTETDRNRLYRFCFRMSCRNQKRKRKPQKRIRKRKSSETDTKRIRDKYVTKNGHLSEQLNTFDCT